MKKTRRKAKQRQALQARAGSIPAEKTQAAAPVAETVEDPILKAAENKLESGLTPKMRNNYNRVVVAGLQVALKGGTNSIAAMIKDSKDVVKDSVIGAVNLTNILRKESRNTMPPEAMVYGSYTLMLHALDLAEKIDMIKVDNVVMTRASKLWTNYIMHMFGVSPHKLQSLGQQVHGVMSDPTTMEHLGRQSGVIKDPRAGTINPAMETSKEPGGGTGLMDQSRGG